MMVHEPRHPALRCRSFPGISSKHSIKTNTRLHVSLLVDLLLNYPLVSSHYSTDNVLALWDLLNTETYFFVTSKSVLSPARILCLQRRSYLPYISEP